MAEVTNELIYEILNHIPDRLSALERKVDEVKSEIRAVRIRSLTMQQDIQNVYAVLGRHDARLDRMERRLEIAEAPA